MLAASFDVRALFATIPLLDRLYFAMVIFAVVGSAGVCIRILRATKARSTAQLNMSARIETQVMHLNAMFRLALLAAAGFALDGIWNSFLFYMVLRFTDADTVPVIHCYRFTTQILLLLLLGMRVMKWWASIAVVRSRPV
jgi:hypothetical protein